ncbi:hypothetical protein GCM10020229_46110 [Kitasatospora albolonga]
MAGASAGQGECLLQAYVSNLRRLLEPGRGPREAARLLVSEGPGYALRLPRSSGALDARDFERLLVRARELRRPGPAREGLGLWSGEAYGEFADRPWALGEVARLGELRLSARELLIELDLERGDSAVAVPQALALTEEHPYREEGWRLLALALWAGHRQAEALDALRRARTLLGEELGLDPSPALADLESAVLHQHTELLPPRARGRVRLNGPTGEGGSADGGGTPGPGDGARPGGVRSDGGAGRETVADGVPLPRTVGTGFATAVAPRPTRPATGLPGSAASRPAGTPGPRWRRRRVGGVGAVRLPFSPGSVVPRCSSGGRTSCAPCAGRRPRWPGAAAGWCWSAVRRGREEHAAAPPAGRTGLRWMAGWRPGGVPRRRGRRRPGMTEALRALAAASAPGPAFAGLLAPLLETEGPSAAPGPEDALAGRFRLPPRGGRLAADRRHRPARWCWCWTTCTPSRPGDQGAAR